MRALIRHPVPVVADLRGRGRILFARALTAVEIPEVAAGAMGPEREYVLSSDGPTRTFHAHAGRCWTRHCEAVPRVLLPYLAEARGHFPPLTPLRAGDVPEGDRGGADLPDAVLAAAREDLTEVARASLRDWVRDNLATDGAHLFMTRGMPVIVPNDRRDPLHSQPLGTLRYGPVFEPARGRHLARYLNRIGHRGNFADRVMGLDRWYGDLYRGDDLDLFVQAGPAAVRRIHQIARERAGPAGGGVPVAPSGLVRDAALGLVGAIPRDRHAESVADVAAALAALAASLPEGYDPPMLRWLHAYAETVALPLLPPPPMPEADAESLGGLAFGP